MRVFMFEITLNYGGKKYEGTRTIRSKHLNGAVRKLYQQEKNPFEIKRILN